MLEIRTDEVETGASAENASEPPRRAGAQGEDDTAKIGLVERGPFLTRAQAQREGSFADRTEIQSTPVVGDVDGNDPRVAARGDVDDAHFGLAQTTTLFGGFDAVSDGVADYVRQWIANRLDEVAVDFRLAASERELHLFAHLCGQAAYETMEAREQSRNRQHSRRLQA